MIPAHPTLTEVIVMSRSEQPGKWTGKEFNDIFVKGKGMKFYKTAKVTDGKHREWCYESEVYYKFPINGIHCMETSEFVFVPEDYCGKFWYSPTHIFEVTIPDDACVNPRTSDDVFGNHSSFVTNKFQLSNPVEITDWIRRLNTNEKKKYIEQGDMARRDITKLAPFDA